MSDQQAESAQASVLIVGVGASRGLGAAIARRFAAGGVSGGDSGAQCGQTRSDSERRVEKRLACA